jgi:hypothetical protein
VFSSIQRSSPLAVLVTVDLDALGLGILLLAIRPPLHEIVASVHVDHGDVAATQGVLAGDVHQRGGLASASLTVDGGDHDGHRPISTKMCFYSHMNP